MPLPLGLRLRGVDMMTFWEDGSHELSDPDILDRATELNRVLFTQDEDLAGTAVFLASPASDFVSGTFINVDGGLKAGDKGWPKPDQPAGE